MMTDRKKNIVFVCEYVCTFVRTDDCICTLCAHRHLEIHWVSLVSAISTVCVEYCIFINSLAAVSFCLCRAAMRKRYLMFLIHIAKLLRFCFVRYSLLVSDHVRLKASDVDEMHTYYTIRRWPTSDIWRWVLGIRIRSLIHVYIMRPSKSLSTATTQNHMRRCEMLQSFAHSHEGHHQAVTVVW